MLINSAKKLFRDGFIYVSGNVFNRLVPFFVVPVLTRVMTPEQYGEVSLILSFIYILTPVIGFNTNTVMSQLYFQDDNVNASHKLESSLRVTAYGALVVVFVSVIVSQFYIVNTQLMVLYFVVVPVVSILYMLTTNCKLVFQLEQKPLYFMVIAFSATIVDAIVTLSMVIDSKEALIGRIYGIVAGAIVGAIIGISLLIRRRHLSRSLFKASRLDLRFLKLGSYLLPTTLAGWFTNYSDRVLLSFLSGNKELGLYSAAITIATVFDLLATSVLQAWLPYFYKTINNINTVVNTKRYTIYLICGLVLAGVCAALILPILSGFYLGDRFANSRQFTMWIVLGFMFRSIGSLLSYYLLNAQRNDLFSLRVLLSSGIQFGLAYLGILFYGAIGLCICFALSGLVSVVITIVLLKRSGSWGESLFKPAVVDR